MKTLTEHKVIRSLFFIILIALIYEYALYLTQRYLPHSGFIFLSSQQLSLSLLEIIFLFTCLLLSRHMSNSWKLIFICLALANIPRLSLTIWPIVVFFHHPENITRIKDNNLLNAAHTLSLLLDLSAWTLITCQLIKKSKGALYKLTPFIPTAITVLLALLFIAAFHQSYIKIRFISSWEIFKACYDMVIFMLVIFCLPMFKNIFLTIFSAGSLLNIIADVFKKNINYTAPYLFVGYYVHFFMILAKLLFVYSTYSLLKLNDKNTNHWLYLPGSTRTQVMYWGNSIASLLLLMIGIHAMIMNHSFEFASFAFRLNVRVLIPFISLLSLLTMFFARMFTQDFEQIKQLANQPSPQRLSIHRNEQNIKFKELRLFSTFLQKKLNVIAEKTASQKKMFYIAGHAAHDIRTPISILSILSNEAKKTLGDEEWCIYKKALTDMQVTADELLALQSKAADQENKGVSQESNLQYAAILLLNFVTKKADKYSKDNIELTYNIAPPNWFLLADIDAQQFSELLAQLIQGETHHLSTQEQQGISISINQTQDPTEFSLCAKQQTINLPLASPVPFWHLDHLNLTTAQDIIIFDDDPLCHQQWDTILLPYLQKRALLTLHHCHSEAEFMQTLKESKSKIILIDYDIHGAAKTGIEYIKELHLNDCSMLVTNNYNHADIQNTCEKERIYLLPKPLMSHITINI